MNLRYVAAAALMLAVVFSVAGSITTSAQEEPKLAKVLEDLRAGDVELPEPLAKHEWLENPDMEDVFDRARDENRPVFVTVRCLPCKQGSWFDKSILQASGGFEDKLRNFICVRLTNMRDMDARLFKFERYQDLDCSWWGYFFDPEGRIYGVYGGVDIDGDKTRQSVQGLQNAMDRVLRYHYHPKRDEWDLFGDAPKLRGRAETPLRHDGFRSWAKHYHRAKEIVEDEESCFHCHEVAEVTRQERFDDEEFDKHTDFYVWPYPENIGVKLDLDLGLKVASVISGSVAEQQGIAAGDVIEAANGQPVFSNADLRRVLHNLPFDDCELRLHTRSSEGELMLVMLEMKGEWRKYDLGWRKSVAEAAIGAHPGFPWPLKGNRQAAGVKAGTLCIKPYMPKGPKGRAADAGLKAGDIIIAVDGESPDLDGRRFNAWFRLKYEPGDEVTITVVNNGKKREITYEVGRTME